MEYVPRLVFANQRGPLFQYFGFEGVLDETEVELTTCRRDRSIRARSRLSARNSDVQRQEASIVVCSQFFQIGDYIFRHNSTNSSIKFLCNRDMTKNLIRGACISRLATTIQI